MVLAAAAIAVAAAVAAVDGMQYMHPEHQSGYFTAPQQPLACCCISALP
jgi:hypothetical protein